ncbi:autotransporter-associated beta strand repeat-containing protein [Bosea sp. BK604]|uniref:autotransporter-associated beta strand repeat-containing protein n=1 Tax=Bosea sp. BK604 TaxID=2512180 RepID=UPI0014046BE7|nr:autotransporter-associated beta strand repeat-containing protein [Bosea sp. BK604]
MSGATGGSGGLGGSSSGFDQASGGGGGGGGGGAGLVVTAATSITNLSTITGGTGGIGGGGGSIDACVSCGIADAGLSGNGGVGVEFTISGAALTNLGTITGGTGSNSGAGVTGSGLTINNSGTISGAYGIIGSDLSITNSGTISGTISAIQFTGGANTLVLQAGAAQGVISLSGGTLTFNQFDDVSLSVLGQLGTTIIQNGSGTLTLATGGSDVRIFSGTVAVGSGLGVGPVTIDGGTFQIYESIVTSNLFRINTTNGTIDTQANFVTLAPAFRIIGNWGSGAIVDGNGPGALTKIGSGQLRLFSVNSYTGSTSVNEGTLALGGVGNIAASSGLTLSPGATFDIQL